MTLPRACGYCAEQRDVLTVFGEELDPTMDQMIEAWHDNNHPGPGPFLADSGWYHPNGQGDGVLLRDVTLAPSEVICAECHLVHRPGTECP
ncbi:hypothetical protein Hosp_078 [Mycobacterium phage Hosp]|uniref:hypothetical protein n=1 Tax=Mycobacterium phage Hosp TaxID=1463811 RepID=UPI00042E99D8|nr:hypothetical protein FH38_gp78 [Mycobacterium phage Hosp]AHK12032.1 hypothetical protein Hosp_078 [Mycobacterium phage Hosp]